MQKYRIVFSLLISLAVLYSCSPIKGLKKDSSIIGVDTVLPVLGTEYSTALYKTSISIGSHYHTGIFLFKNNPEENSTNIVLLSEFGLNLIEMKYKDNKIEVISIQDFINNKIFMSNLKSCILPLLINIKNTKDYNIYTNDNNSIKVIKTKHNSNRYYYFCNENNLVYKIVNQRVLKGDITIELNHGFNNFPKSMIFVNDRVNLEMEMNLVKFN